MKVLHLVASLGTGGAERQLYLLCRDSEREVGHSVVSLSGDDRWAGPLRELGVSVWQLGAQSLRDPRLVLRLRKWIVGTAPDVVHCWLPSMNVLGTLASRLLSRPRPRVVASVRNVDTWKPLLYRLLERTVEPLWDAVICNSQAGLEVSASSGIPRNKLYLVPNGIPEAAPASEAERVQARAELGLATAELVVSTVSRLVHQKRVDLFLRAASAILSEVPGARFLIAGDGPERSMLESRARELGSAVRFAGHTENVRPILAASDMFLLCSEREGMSNALLEAMQAGCAPVVSPAGDNGHIVTNGSCGLVMAPDGMAKAVITLHRNRALLERYRKAASLRASQFGVAAMSEQTVSLYRRLSPSQAAHIPVPCYE